MLHLFRMSRGTAFVISTFVKRIKERVGWCCIYVECAEDRRFQFWRLQNVLRIGSHRVESVSDRVGSVWDRVGPGIRVGSASGPVLEHTFFTR